MILFPIFARAESSRRPLPLQGSPRNARGRTFYLPFLGTADNYFFFNAPFLLVIDISFGIELPAFSLATSARTFFMSYFRFRTACMARTASLSSPSSLFLPPLELHPPIDGRRRLFYHPQSGDVARVTFARGVRAIFPPLRSTPTRRLSLAPGPTKGVASKLENASSSRSPAFFPSIPRLPHIFLSF